jgi:CBS domain-containing protein
MEVKEILKLKDSTLFSAHPSTLLSEAVIMMADHDIGAIVVVEADKVVGMLTFREVITVLAKRQTERCVGPTPPIAEILVGEAMQPNPPTTDPSMDIDDLRKLMVSTHSRYVPVMDGDKILCVISLRDIAKAVLEERNFENRLLKAYIKDWPEKAEAEAMA